MVSGVAIGEESPSSFFPGTLGCTGHLIQKIIEKDLRSMQWMQLPFLCLICIVMQEVWLGNPVSWYAIGDLASLVWSRVRHKHIVRKTDGE